MERPPDDHRLEGKPGRVIAPSQPAARAGEIVDRMLDIGGIDADRIGGEPDGGGPAPPPRDEADRARNFAQPGQQHGFTGQRHPGRHDRQKRVRKSHMQDARHAIGDGQHPAGHHARPFATGRSHHAARAHARGRRIIGDADADRHGHGSGDGITVSGLCKLARPHSMDPLPETIANSVILRPMAVRSPSRSRARTRPPPSGDGRRQRPGCWRSARHG